jgi:DNA polymerase epsilon subunit 1
MLHHFDGARVRWVCGKRGGEYNRIGIEMELVRLFGLLERAFMQQVMRCGC